MKSAAASPRDGTLLSITIPSKHVNTGIDALRTFQRFSVLGDPSEAG